MSIAAGLFRYAATLFLISLLTSITPASARTNHALVVAVSQYPNLDKDLWLKGPKNDAELVSQFLLNNRLVEFKGTNIVTLADGIDRVELPTLDNIRKAAREITEKLQPGDFVYLHFSGHGSQAPALLADEEADGLDELFLPYDTGPWNKNTGDVDNALVDDEIGTMIGKMRKRGATVWAVFDSCHSGTVTRAVPAGTGLDRPVARKLSPSALKIPDDAWFDARRVSTRSTGGPSSPSSKSGKSGKKAENTSLVAHTKGDAGDGRFIAFYAAQTYETTPEMRLPSGMPGRITHGLFTFTLFETLARYPALTYRQLGQEVLRRYATKYVAEPTPMFEGDLDSGVFGLEGISAIRQWPVSQGSEGLTVAAGRIHGLAPGNQLLLLNSPADSNDDAVARLKIDATKTLSSSVSIADDRFIVIPDFAHARQVSKELNFALTVSRPETAGLTPQERDLVQATLDQLVAEEGTGLRLQMVGTGQPADIRLASPSLKELAEWADDGDGDGDTASEFKAPHLWLLPSSGAITLSGPTKSFSIGLSAPDSETGTLRDPQTVAALLADSLSHMARTANLLKLGDIAGPNNLDLTVRFRVRKRNGETFRDLDNAAVAKLVPDDGLYMTATNDTPYPLDLNVLYLGSDQSIQFMYKEQIKSGATRKKGLFWVNDKSFGRERLILITTKVKPQGGLTDLSWLSQPALPRTRSTSDKPTGFVGLLRQSGFGNATRTVTAMGEDDGETAGTVAQLQILTAPAH